MALQEIKLSLVALQSLRWRWNLCLLLLFMLSAVFSSCTEEAGGIEILPASVFGRVPNRANIQCVEAQIPSTDEDAHEICD